MYSEGTCKCSTCYTLAFMALMLLLNGQIVLSNVRDFKN